MNNSVGDRKSAYILDYFLPIILVAITFMWYQNNNWSVLMGDDLIAVTGFKNLGFWGNLFCADDIAMGKIRPIQKAMLYVVYYFCGIDYKAYYIVSRILVAIAAISFYLGSRKINGNRILSVGVAVLIVTCPFSAYGAWQYIGVSESFSLICCVLYGVTAYKTIWCEDNLKNHIFLSIIFALLIFNSERFMYICAVTILMICINFGVKWRRKILYIFILIWPILLRSVLIKVLGSTSLGTGREDIGTLLSTLVPYAIKGYINMIGFSIGDDWHGGFSIVQLSPLILMISSLQLFIFMGVLFDVCRLTFVEKRKKYLSIIMWYLFSLTSLFSYALVGATHGEDRFLWVPYAFYLFALVDYATKQLGDKKENNTTGKKSFKNIAWRVCTLGACVIILVSNYYYFNLKTHVNFRYSQEMAETAKESIELLEGFENVENIAFVNPNDYSWVFYGNSFTSFYISESANSYHYNSVDELNKNRELLGDNTIVIYPDLSHDVPYGAKAYWINDFHEE
ncbi:hypothetical protein [Aminipila sp.]|uniref:hypothetical protein n=1 Tax=Aminipila sp. TaxID=2060095 RepID=UPI00289B181E|nr:hypothetical protein [Aminipila sp.]